MRYKGREKSKNVEDRRRGGGKKVGAGLGLTTIIAVAVAIFMNMGGENSGGSNTGAMMDQIGEALSNANTGGDQTAAPGPTSAKEDELAEFVSVVLKDCEDVWNKLFREEFRANYDEPTLVLFSGKVSSACGFASAATGPFYCPGDQKLYIDLSFYDELKTKFGAPGDFAMAYVVAHEVAHHVQYLMGTTTEVHQAKQRVSKVEGNRLSVMLELQADFYAGVWAHHAEDMKDILEEGDIDEALRAANAIGDDRMQKKARGYVVPESFTHGTSAQRVSWFRKGFKTGDIDKGDTFNAPSL